MYFLPLFSAQFVALAFASLAWSHDFGIGAVLGFYSGIGAATFILMSIAYVCIWSPQPDEVEIQHDILALNEIGKGH